ncbi:hypothetical protein SAMN05192529_11010 [Arachidicoccus rhizosphaerae]|uniref:Uncharacterized protein n=1 Tax=Arachidicoccus rhizosphaerae TaxID=551991 RepID=A0A1H3Z4A3_9BACT|nr:hypothetical protein SAMN05192529_11010 [Arachidicoccus rhizosphaerae]
MIKDFIAYIYLDLKKNWWQLIISVALGFIYGYFFM